MYSDEELAGLAEHLSEEELVEALAEREAEVFADYAGRQLESLERDLGRTLTGSENKRVTNALMRQFDDGRDADAARAFYGTLDDPNDGAQLWAKYQATGNAIDPVDDAAALFDQRLDDLYREQEAEEEKPALPIGATSNESADFTDALWNNDADEMQRIIDVIQARQADEMPDATPGD